MGRLRGASGLDSGVHSRIYARIMSATEGAVEPSGLVRISDLAAQAGVTPDTLRYYERVGLLPPPHRTRTGYRLYDGATADRIGFIHKAQALGLTLEEVREGSRWRRARRHRASTSGRFCPVASRKFKVGSRSWNHCSGRLHGRSLAAGPFRSRVRACAELSSPQRCLGTE